MGSFSNKNNNIIIIVLFSFGQSGIPLWNNSSEMCIKLQGRL